MADYAKLYEQLLKEMQPGPGMGDRGLGEGGEAPEDDTVKSDFKTEQSKSPITAGKVLLSLKTKGVGEKGDAKTAYRDAMREVTQGVSEAILTEQIPPGYHDGIRNYFDSIKNSDGSSQPSESDSPSQPSVSDSPSQPSETPNAQP
jgi:hypothetical protein